MTDPSATERARQLGAEAAHLYGVTKRRKETLRAAEEQALKVIGEASSPDGSVKATVDAGGMLTELVLSDKARRVPDLAGLITSVTQEAAADARAAVREMYEPLRGEGIVRGLPVLLPEPVSAPQQSRRQEVEEEAPYGERSITRRSGRR